MELLVGVCVFSKTDVLTLGNLSIRHVLLGSSPPKYSSTGPELLQQKLSILGIPHLDMLYSRKRGTLSPPTAKHISRLKGVQSYYR